MKQIFRFLSSELNGFYISSLNNFLNVYISKVVDTLARMMSLQFVTEGEVPDIHTSPMSDSEIRGIGRTAGLYSPYISAESNLGSLVFGPRMTVGGQLYSERGLFDMQGELFKFFRTNTSSYESDITTLATKDLRTSFIPHDAPVIGYIPMNVQALTEDGKIIPEAILPDPPEDVPYFPYYGDKYLFLAETFLIEAFLDISTYKSLLESYQKVRYNGASIEEFCNVTVNIMGDYVKDVHFEQDGVRTIVYYKLNEDSEVTGKVKRLYVWKLLVETKFKMFYLEEEIV